MCYAICFHFHSFALRLWLNRLSQDGRVCVYECMRVCAPVAAAQYS